MKCEVTWLSITSLMWEPRGFVCRYPIYRHYSFW